MPLAETSTLSSRHDLQSIGETWQKMAYFWFLLHRPHSEKLITSMIHKREAKILLLLHLFSPDAAALVVDHLGGTAQSVCANGLDAWAHHQNESYIWKKLSLAARVSMLFSICAISIVPSLLLSIMQPSCKVVVPFSDGSRFVPKTSHYLSRYQHPNAFQVHLYKPNLKILKCKDSITLRMS